MGQLQGKVCVVTGGAGSVGLASARLFVQEGAKVMLVDLTDAELRRAHATLKSENVSYVAADVSKADDAKRYIDKTVATFGKIDVLFSNAGNFGVVRPIHEYPEDVFDSVYAVHVKGAFLAAKYGVPQMNDGGSMIITSSYNNCRLQRGVRLRPEAATAQIHRASTGRRARLAACGG